MSPRREIELKLELPTDSLSRLTASPLLKDMAASGRRPASLVSVYFDTDALKLHQKGLSLRVRRIGRRLVQTVKRDNGAGAPLFARDEWEHDIRTRQPDLEAARDTALGPLLSKKLRRGLKPVFETRVRRKVFALRSGASEVELSIDRGTVEAGRRSSTICEVELELKHGQAADLFKLAKILARQAPLRLAVKSKSERGYALLASGKPQAAGAGAIALAPDADARSAFQAVAKACLHQLAANQAVMLDGDPEGLHQMRVALRRLRAAISLFPGMLETAQTDALKAELKWITGELGPARELEIFLKRVVKPAADRTPRAAEMEVLSRELRRRRRTAIARARDAVDSERFRDLVLDAAAWIEAGDWTRSRDSLVRILRQRPIAQAAAEQLHRRRKKIVKRGRHLDRLDPQHRHRLRIHVKKLRYAAEFFGSAFPGKKSMHRLRDFVTALERLQDALGDINDIRVHEHLSAQFIDGENAGGKPIRAGKAFAAGRLSGREEARLAPMMEEARRAYAAFAKARPFWA